MLFFKLIIFASFLAGFYCMSIECFYITEQECHEYEVEEPALPETTEELRELCRRIIPLEECVLGVLEKCAKDEDTWDNEEHVTQFRNTLDFIKSSCDEDSEIFRALSNNVQCMTPTLNNMDDICSYRGMNETLYEKLTNLIDEEEGCITEAWTMYCINAKVDVECGKDARDAISQILFNVDNVLPYCIALFPRMSYFEDAFKSEFLQGKSGDSVIRGVLEAISKKEE